MKSTGRIRLVLAGTVLVTLFAAPSATAGTLDLGTVAYAYNMNGFLIYQNQLQTYTYQQLTFGPDANTLGILLDSLLTVGETLVNDLGEPDAGSLTYNFPFPLGASGSYAQNDVPAFPPVSEIGPGILHNFTAENVSGNICNGANSVGAALNLDPTAVVSTFETILACDSFSGLEGGILTSSTTKITLTLGIAGGNAITGEVVTTTFWNYLPNPQSAPEPSSFWLAALSFVGLCRLGIRRRSHATIRR